MAHLILMAPSSGDPLQRLAGIELLDGSASSRRLSAVIAAQDAEDVAANRHLGTLVAEWWYSAEDSDGDDDDDTDSEDGEANELDDYPAGGVLTISVLFG